MSADAFNSLGGFSVGIPPTQFIDNTGNITIPNKQLSADIIFANGYFYGNGEPLNSNFISYTPTTPTDWNLPAPTTMQEAIDRLATVVKSLNGGTGA